MRTLLCLLLPLLTSALRLTSVSSDVNVMKDPVIRGSTKPLEQFDPFQFSKDESRMDFLR